MSAADPPPPLCNRIKVPLGEARSISTSDTQEWVRFTSTSTSVRVNPPERVMVSMVGGRALEIGVPGALVPVSPPICGTRSQLSRVPLPLQSVADPSASSQASGRPLPLQSAAPPVISQSFGTPFPSQSASHSSGMPLPLQSVDPGPPRVPSTSTVQSIKVPSSPPAVSTMVIVQLPSPA